MGSSVALRAIEHPYAFVRTYPNKVFDLDADAATHLAGCRMLEVMGVRNLELLWGSDIYRSPEVMVLTRRPSQGAASKGPRATQRGSQGRAQRCVKCFVLLTRAIPTAQDFQELG